MAPKDNTDFYKMLDSVAETTRDEDAIQQNKRIKEAQIAEDSREPTEAEIKAIRKELQEEKNHGSTPVSFFTTATTQDTVLREIRRRQIQQRNKN